MPVPPPASDALLRSRPFPAPGQRRLPDAQGAVIDPYPGRCAGCHPRFDVCAMVAAVQAVAWRRDHRGLPGASSGDRPPASMTRALDRLEAKGLVVRERSTTDRRVVQLALTEEGRGGGPGSRRAVRSAQWPSHRFQPRGMAKPAGHAAPHAGQWRSAAPANGATLDTPR